MTWKVLRSPQSGRVKLTRPGHSLSPFLPVASSGVEPPWRWQRSGLLTSLSLLQRAGQCGKSQPKGQGRFQQLHGASRFFRPLPAVPPPNDATEHGPRWYCASRASIVSCNSTENTRRTDSSLAGRILHVLEDICRLDVPGCR